MPGAGCAALKKGWKPGWVVVAVDSLAVGSERELRDAIDQRLRGSGHCYQVHCRVDEASAKAWVRRGQACMKLHQYAAARKNLTRACTLAPSSRTPTSTAATPGQTSLLWLPR